jgi:hypothetical protein
MSFDDVKTKPVGDRITECMNIKKQISSLGLLILDGVSSKLSENMNNFIKNGVSRQFKIHIPHQHAYLEVRLCVSQGIKSGVTFVGA